MEAFARYSTVRVTDNTSHIVVKTDITIGKIGIVKLCKKIAQITRNLNLTDPATSS